MDEFLGMTVFEAAALTVTEIRLALGGQKGRSVQIRPAESGYSSWD